MADRITPCFIAFANAPALKTRHDLKPVIEAIREEYPGAFPPGASLLMSDDLHGYDEFELLQNELGLPDDFPEGLWTTESLGLNGVDLEGWYNVIHQLDNEEQRNCPSCLPPLGFNWNIESNELFGSCFECKQFYFRQNLDFLVEGEAVGFVLEFYISPNWFEPAASVRALKPAVIRDSVEIVPSFQHSILFSDPTYYLTGIIGSSLADFLLHNDRAKLKRCQWCDKFFVAQRKTAKFCSDRCRYDFHNSTPEARERKRKLWKKRGHIYMANRS